MNIITIYKRFKQNHRNDNGGINLYPQFDYDLDMLMEWIEGELDLASDTSVDCSWRAPEGGNEWQGQ